MKLSRRLISIAAVALLAPAGAVVASAPASAAEGCPANHLCLYSEKNFTGERLFAVSGTTMFNVQGNYSSNGLKSKPSQSSINNTTGKFITYDVYGRATNVLAAGTRGNLASTHVYHVRFSW